MPEKLSLQKLLYVLVFHIVCLRNSVELLLGLYDVLADPVARRFRDCQGGEEVEESPGD